MRIVLTLIMVLVAPTAWAQTMVGVVDALAGSATMAGAPLQAGASIAASAEVRTGPDSRLRIKLPDGTSLTLGPDSAFRLDHLAAANDNRPTLVRHLLGFLRASVAPQTGPGGLEIDTDTDAAAVRGTEWIERATPGRTELFVVSGHVAISGGGGSVLLGPGQGVTFRAARPHTPVIRWAPQKVAAFNAATTLP